MNVRQIHAFREVLSQKTVMPMRRFLTREEAAGYLGMSIDTFNQLGIPHIQLRQRTFRWDVNDIDSCPPAYGRVSHETV